MTAATRQAPPFEGAPPPDFDPAIPSPFEGEATPFPPSGPSLEDAALAGPPPAATPADETPAPAMTNAQIIGLVANLTAFGLPPEVAAAYVEDYQSNALVQLGVQMSGLADALQEYGLSANGGKLPAWASVLVGMGVLGYGVYITRGKYVPSQFDPTAAAGAAGGLFGVAGVGTPLQPDSVPLNTAGLGGLDG